MEARVMGTKAAVARAVAAKAAAARAAVAESAACLPALPEGGSAGVAWVSGVGGSDGTATGDDEK